MSDDVSDDLSVLLNSIANELGVLARRFDMDSGIVSAYLAKTDLALVPELNKALQRNDAAFQIMQGIAGVLRHIGNGALEATIREGAAPTLLREALSTIRIEELRLALSGQSQPENGESGDEMWD